MAITQTVTYSTTANERSANLLAGGQLERLPFNAKINMAINGSTTSTLHATVIVGGTTFLDDVRINEKGSFPIRDDFIYSALGVAGDLVQFIIREAAGGASESVEAVFIAEPI